MILGHKFVWAKYYQYKSNLIIFRIFSVYKRVRETIKKLAIFNELLQNQKSILPKNLFLSSI